LPWPYSQDCGSTVACPTDINPQHLRMANDLPIGPSNRRVVKESHSAAYLFGTRARLHSGVARAVPGIWLFEASVDPKSNERNDIGVGDDVDHSLALTVGAYDAGQLELTQVMTDGGEALTRGDGQGPHVAVAVGELPQDVQSYGGRQ
jgi:hypothetical protein